MLVITPLGHASSLFPNFVRDLSQAVLPNQVSVISPPSRSYLPGTAVNISKAPQIVLETRLPSLPPSPQSSTYSRREKENGADSRPAGQGARGKKKRPPTDDCQCQPAYHLCGQPETRTGASGAVFLSASRFAVGVGRRRKREKRTERGE